MKRREIFIELTSLLDVIMIMLFVLLTQARTQTADAPPAAEADRAEAAAVRAELNELRGELGRTQRERDEAREEAAAWQRQLISDDFVLENSLVVTLSVDERAVIRLETEGQRQTIAYRWEDDNYARNALRAALNTAASGDKAVFLVFQYDRAAIYRTEYDMIRELLQELKLSAREREASLSILELDRSNA